MAERRDSMDLYTIGHSNRSVDEFMALLNPIGIKQLVDVRTAAGSRKSPQFGKVELVETLQQHDIRYTHMPALGGFRKPQPDSINSAWRNTSFRGYADYMRTPAFEAALMGLLEIVDREPTVIMCAEAVPWRCHRSLIADAAVARGFAVSDILSVTTCKPHVLTSFARVEDGRVTYPSGTEHAESGSQAQRHVYDAR